MDPKCDFRFLIPGFRGEKKTYQHLHDIFPKGQQTVHLFFYRKIAVEFREISLEISPISA